MASHESFCGKLPTRAPSRAVALGRAAARVSMSARRMCARSDATQWSRRRPQSSLWRVADLADVALDAMYLALRLALPLLGVAFVIALVIGLVQLLTQLREPALAAVPRLIGVGLVLALSFGVMSSELRGFATRLYRALPELVAGL